MKGSKYLALRKLRNHTHSDSGFTIVELLVVIVVIGILATITIVSYIGINQKAVVASLQADLANASKQLGIFQVTNSAYPNSVTDCPTPVSTNICLKASSSNTVSSYSANNSTNPQSYSLIIANGSNIYKVSNSTQPTQLASAPLSPVADWLATTQGDHYGNFYDLITNSWATVTRAGTGKTIYDPSTNHIYDVPTNYLGVRPRSDAKEGSEAIVESGATNYFLQSTMANQTALNTWTADSGLTATLGGTSLYASANEVNLSASSSNAAFWRTLTSSAVTRAISVYVRKSDGSAVTSSDMQLAAVAGSSTPVGSLLTTTFTQQGTSTTYRATAVYTGTATTWAVGIAVKANKSIIIACPQEEWNWNGNSGITTSYISTTTAAMTRNTDVVTVPTSTWSSSAGTWVLVVGPDSFPSYDEYMASWIKDVSNSIKYLRNGGTYGGSVFAAITAGTYYQAGNAGLPGTNVYAGTYASGIPSQSYQNGTIGWTQNGNAVTTSGFPSTAYIGSNGVGSYVYNGPIQRFTVYSSALSSGNVSTVTNAVQNGP